MPIEIIGAGSIATADVRKALTATSPLPTEPHFVLRASQPVPLALSTLALDFTDLLPQTVQTTNGFLAVPIHQPLAPGQRLIWTVLTGAVIPRIAAYLAINGKLNYLKHKDDLAAGEPWAPTPVTLRPQHLS